MPEPESTSPAPAAGPGAPRAGRARQPVVLVIAAVIFFLALPALFVPLQRLQAFKIPSGSMMPNLLIGDHIFVDKRRRGTRGDVIVFPFPEHPEQDFVKRIIAVDGERIEFQDSHPVVNGTPVPSCLIGSWSYSDNSEPHTGALFLEKVGDQPYVAFYEEQASLAYGHQGPWEVKPGEVFVVGDNRNNAHDSRMWFGGNGGGVRSTTVIGVAKNVWMSITDEGVDWSRCGTSLEEPRLPKSAASLAPKLAACLSKVRGH